MSLQAAAAAVAAAIDYFYRRKGVKARATTPPRVLSVFLSLQKYINGNIVVFAYSRREIAWTELQVSINVMFRDEMRYLLPVNILFASAFTSAT